jgi:hypothetical protein
LYGDGRNADMTYYVAPNGSQVFAAGAFSLAAWVTDPTVRRLMASCGRTSDEIGR